jgi:hypothetical protein
VGYTCGIYCQDLTPLKRCSLLSTWPGLAMQI